MKIIGMLNTWNNLEFFRCALKQALEFCDEVVLVEGCTSEQYPKRSTDGTCEYIETMKNHPKLRLMDFEYKGRYDYTTQWLRQEFPKTSEFYKVGNWIVLCDDDLFYTKESLLKMKAAMEKPEVDAITVFMRNFFYNFRFNFMCTKAPLIGYMAWRIVDGLHMRGICTPCYGNGKRIPLQFVDGVMCFHYGHVKRPERMKARWVQSIEKGTKASIGRFEKWMSVSWNEDKDIFNSRKILESIRPGETLNVYNGEHPEVLDAHPWRHIDDVRKVK